MFDVRLTISIVKYKNDIIYLQLLNYLEPIIVYEWVQMKCYTVKIDFVSFFTHEWADFHGRQAFAGSNKTNFARDGEIKIWNFKTKYNIKYG